MKKHKMVNGRLLNLNKKFSDLSQKQQVFIKDLIRDKYNENISLGFKSQELNAVVLTAVQKEIDTRGVWLPYSELKKAYYSYKSRLTRKTVT